MNGNISIDGFEVDCKNDYAVVALSSLNNDLDIEHTDSMLMTTVGTAQNTDMKMSLAPAEVQPDDGLPPYLQMDDFGRPPIICEVIEATVKIKTVRRNLVVWAVNAEGIFVGTIPVRYEDGYAVIEIGQKFPSIYYFIQAE